jgi:hypothetical protein
VATGRVWYKTRKPINTLVLSEKQLSPGDIHKQTAFLRSIILGENRLFGSFSSIGDLKIKMINPECLIQITERTGPGKVFGACVLSA